MQRPARHRLSIGIATLMAAASAGGLLIDSLYRDNQLVSSGWRGNDLVSLFVATPLLVIALLAAGRGSLRGTLAWLGLLDYTLYNYAFYLFGAGFNAFFLLYVALFTLSIFALVFGLADLDVPAIAGRFDARTPVRAISAFLALVAIGLGGYHVGVAALFVRTGEIPAIVLAVGHPTNVIAALDLSLVVSVSALGAFWLWRREPWGYVIAAITTIKGALYMLALSSATVAALRAGASSDVSSLGLWGTIGLGCLISAGVLLGHLNDVR